MKFLILYVPHDSRINALIHMMGDPVVVYPSYVDQRLNTYGLGMFYGTPESRFLPSPQIFDFIDFSSDDFFIFKTRAFQFLEPVIRNIYRPFLVHGGSLFFADCENILPLEGWDILGAEPPFPEMMIRLIDSQTCDFNPLMHLLSFDRNMDNEKKNCLMLAIQKGFPHKGTKELIESSKEIEIFADILQESITVFAKLNKANFLSIAEVLSGKPNTVNDMIPSTESLSLFIKRAYPDTRVLSEPKLPQIFVTSVTVDAIFELDDGSLEAMLTNLMSYKPKIGSIRIVDYSESSPSFHIPDYKRRRFRCKWDTGQFSIGIDQIPHLMDDFEKFTIAPALRDTDPNSYLNFRRKRSKEFWIRSVRLVIFVSNEFSEIVEKTAKDHFLETILIKERKPAIKVEPMDVDTKKISFDVYLRRYHDYVISKRKYGLFFSEVEAFDQFTLRAIEYARKRHFNKALEFLGRGRCALEADLMMWNYRCTGGSDSEALKKARELYRKAKIRNPPLDESTPCYLLREIPERIMRALRANQEWKNSILLYKEGIKIRKEILKNPFIDRICSSISNAEFANLCFAYSDLVPVRDTFDFVDNLSSFYAKMLSNIQEVSKDMTAKWAFF